MPVLSVTISFLQIIIYAPSCSNAVLCGLSVRKTNIIMLNIALVKTCVKYTIDSFCIVRVQHTLIEHMSQSRSGIHCFSFKVLLHSCYVSLPLSCHLLIGNRLNNLPWPQVGWPIVQRKYNINLSGGTNTVLIFVVKLKVQVQVIPKILVLMTLNAIKQTHLRSS
jgi:hypothetical protein